MGTADKVYSVILAVKDQAERLNIDYSQTSLIVVEIGFAYTSAIAVKNGQIVDAMAGTAGFPSYLGMGFMDSELVYALSNTVKDLSKLLLFSGGAAYIAGINPHRISPEEFVKLAKTKMEVKRGYDLMIESIVKDVAALLPSTKPKEIVLSGRFTRIPDFLRDVEEKLSEFFREIGLKASVVKLRSSAKVAKEAEGAAIFANGIAGGKFKRLVDVIKLKESKGTIFDHIFLSKDIIEGLDMFKKLAI